MYDVHSLGHCELYELVVMGLVFVQSDLSSTEPRRLHSSLSPYKHRVERNLLVALSLTVDGWVSFSRLFVEPHGHCKT